MTLKELEHLRTHMRAYMTNTGQSMRAFAIEAELNIDAVRDILRGKSTNPKLATLEALAETMGLDIDRMLGRTDEIVQTKVNLSAEQAVNVEAIANFLLTHMAKRVGTDKIYPLLDYLFKPTSPGTEERRQQDALWNGLAEDVEGWAEKVGVELRLLPARLGDSEK